MNDFLLRESSLPELLNESNRAQKHRFAKNVVGFCFILIILHFRLYFPILDLFPLEFRSLSSRQSSLINPCYGTKGGQSRWDDHDRNHWRINHLGVILSMHCFFRFFSSFFSSHLECLFYHFLTDDSPF